MHWNLNFALLPLISQWEFTQDLAAARAALPLLEGASAWWGCFLAEDPATGLLHDANAANPDAQHEGQLVADPQIGLALALRGAAAHVDVAGALGLPPPADALRILARLAPFNTASVGLPPRPPPAPRNFSRLPNTRLAGDDHMGSAASADDCQAQCSASAGCQCFTFCPSSAVAGCPLGPSCWFYPPAAAGSARAGAGFTSGCAAAPPPPLVNATVWTSFAAAAPAQSDTFALYPVYPAEALGGLLRLDARSAATAQASSPLYTGSWVSDRRPLDVFVAAALGLSAAPAGGALPPTPRSATTRPTGAGHNGGALGGALRLRVALRVAVRVRVGVGGVCHASTTRPGLLA